VRALGKFGWEQARQTGSHIVLKKGGAMATLSVPNHSTLDRGILRALIRVAGISVDEFTAALKA
jgi:predicted RNA binding protein YcfA (HicA-like mRNA interferase family)